MRRPIAPRLFQYATRTAVVLVFGSVALLGVVAAWINGRDAERRVADQQRELAETHTRMDALRKDSDELHNQIRAVRMLYAFEEKTDAGEHIVSPDGQLEMFTHHDTAGHLCAHWCARQDPGGPCLDLGPDRCLP